MTRTEELLALAEAATQFDWTRNSEGWVNHSDNWDAQDFIAAANPETIKQLVELVRLQHEALQITVSACQDQREAIAAFEKFEGGE